MNRKQQLLIGTLLLAIGLFFCYWAFIDPASAIPPEQVRGVGRVIATLGGYRVFGPLSVVLGLWRIVGAMRRRK